MKSSRSTKLFVYIAYSIYMYVYVYKWNHPCSTLLYSYHTSTYSMIWHISIDETIPSPFLSFPTRQLIEILSEINTGQKFNREKCKVFDAIRTFCNSRSWYVCPDTKMLCLKNRIPGKITIGRTMSPFCLSLIWVEEKRIDDIIPELYLLESNCFTFVLICAMFGTCACFALCSLGCGEVCMVELKMKQLVRLQLSAPASSEIGEGNAALPLL